MTLNIMEQKRLSDELKEIDDKLLEYKNTKETYADADYLDDHLSDDMKERHANTDANVFTVDGIPSRWEHNKLHSKWNYDAMAPTSDDDYKVICQFQGDWSEEIKHAYEDATEDTLRNYRPRDASKEDYDMNDGERLDMLKAGGLEDLAAMWNIVFYNASRPDKKYIKGYDKFLKIINELGLDCHQGRVHIQRLGQMTPMHIDNQMRYARKKWRKIWKDGRGDKDPLKLRRFLIALNDWDYGHAWQFGNSMYSQYRAGECVDWDWTRIPHGTANFGFTDRLTLQLTGFITDKTRELMEAGHKDWIIKV
jgi:hypothetical protein